MANAASEAAAAATHMRAATIGSASIVSGANTLASVAAAAASASASMSAAAAAANAEDDFAADDDADDGLEAVAEVEGWRIAAHERMPAALNTEDKRTARRRLAMWSAIELELCA